MSPALENMLGELQSIVRNSSTKDLLLTQLMLATRDIHTSARFEFDCYPEHYTSELCRVQNLYKDTVDYSDEPLSASIVSIVVDGVKSAQADFARLYSHPLKDNLTAWASFNSTATILSLRPFSEILVTYHALPDITVSNFNSKLVDLGFSSIIVYLAASRVLNIINDNSYVFWYNQHTQLLRKARLPCLR